MPTRRSKETTRDLFSVRPTMKAVEPLTISESEAKPGGISPLRHLLPKDLAGALKRLDDSELDALLAAVTAEAERRGRQPPSPAKEKVSVTARPQSRQAPAGPGSLTTAKLNAVRAAFKAGVKPTTIARQFGISQSDVRKALATEGRNRKSDR